MAASIITENQRQALSQAAHWFAVLGAEDVTARQNQQWQRWLEQHTDHRWAWSKVEALQGQLQAMPGKMSYQVLNNANQQVAVTRRRVLKSLLVLLGVGVSWRLWQSPAALGYRAELRTATGEIKPLHLSDGSLVVMNTATAADLQFTAQQRMILLYQGEIAIHTASDPSPIPRPFLVSTAQGKLRALGTQFTVRALGDETVLAVQQHSVEVSLRNAPEAALIVSQGQQVSFTADRFGVLMAAESNSADWTQGVLTVSDRPLSQVIEEIARYRRGSITCSPEVAHLRVSGTFPLKDTDRILDVLAQTLPIKIQSVTRYWVKVVAA